MKLITAILTAKVLIAIIVYVVIFCIMADTTVTLKPFSIVFKDLMYAMGYTLLFVGITMIYHAGQSKGREISEEMIRKELIEFELQKNKPF